MLNQSTKPYWIDDLQRKHEAYGYDESDVRYVEILYQGRTLRLIVPESIPLFDVKVSASVGDILFLAGEQLDEEDIDGEIIEGGDGIVMVARRHRDRNDTYWLLVWHNLYPEALAHLPAWQGPAGGDE